MSICPVCGLEGIAPERPRCPQCDADLTCFQVLDALPDEVAEKPRRAGTRLDRFIGTGMAALLVVVVVMISVAGLYRFRRIESRLDDQKRIVAESLADLDGRLQRLAAEASGPAENPEETPPGETGDPGEEETSAAETGGPGEEETAMALPASREPEKTDQTEETKETKETVPAADDSRAGPGFWTYQAGDSDTLWGIAGRFYGKGHYYPVLMEHNPEIGLFSIGSEVRLKVLQDPGLAGEIYGRIVKKEGRRLIWHYTVAQGDTLESISRKFYKTDENMRRILDLNPGIRLDPGARIRIQLE